MGLLGLILRLDLDIFFSLIVSDSVRVWERKQRVIFYFLFLKFPVSKRAFDPIRVHGFWAEIWRCLKWSKHGEEAIPANLVKVRFLELWNFG